jgi:ELWxxDGT repeat protein
MNMKNKYSVQSLFFAALCCLICPFSTLAQLKFEHDINKQAANTRIHYPKVIDGKLYFKSNDGYFGYELFQFDPETEETTRLTDLQKAGGDSDPRELISYNGKVFFVAYTDDNMWQLFSFNPENEVLQKINSIQSGFEYIRDLVVFQQKLWFSAQYQGRVNLWSYSDFTGAMEEILPPANAHQTNFSPNHMGGHNDELYFTAQDTAYKLSVYKYNPQTGLMNKVPTQYDNSPEFFNVNTFVSCEGKLLMRVFNGVYKTNWQNYDESGDSCVVLHPNWNSSETESVACFDGKFWFRGGNSAYVFDPTTQQALSIATWTTNVPNQIKDFHVIDGNLYAHGDLNFNVSGAIFKLNNQFQYWEHQSVFQHSIPYVYTELASVISYNDIFYAASHQSNDFEIYKYTPATNTIELLTNINQGNKGSANAAHFYEYDGRILFNAVDSSVYRLWQKDLVSGQFSPFSVPVSAEGNWNVYMDHAVTIGDRLYFSGARSGYLRRQLLSYKTGEDTLKWHGNATNLGSIYPWVTTLTDMVAKDSTIYFVSVREEGNYDTLRLFKYDLRTDAMKLLEGAEHIVYPKELTIVGDKLYFTTSKYVDNDEKWSLWQHDLAGNLSEISLDSFLRPSNLLEFDGKLLFNALVPRQNSFALGYICIFDPETSL